MQAAHRDAGAVSPNSGWLFSRDQPRLQNGNDGGRSGSPGVPKGQVGSKKGHEEEAGAWRARSCRTVRRRAWQVSALPEPPRSLSTLRVQGTYPCLCSSELVRSTEGLSCNHSSAGGSLLLGRYHCPETHSNTGIQVCPADRPKGCKLSVL